MLEGATVLGASGFIGTRLVARLKDQGVGRIVAIDIAPPRRRHDGVEYVTADVRRPVEPQWAPRGGVIYNFAAVHRTPGHPPHEYYDTNIYGALNACRLAEETQARQLVFTSSISVYGPSEETVHEGSDLAPISDYGRSKAMAEAIHREWMRLDDTRRLTIVRPAVVFGPGERGNYTRLARALSRGYFAYPGRSSTVKSGGYVDELLQAIAFATTREERYVLFNFAFPAMSSTADIVAAFSSVTGKRFSPVTIPLGPVLLAAKTAHGLTRTSTFHPDRVMKLVQSTRVAPSWLVSQGYGFRFDLDTALQAWSAETAGSFD